MITDIRLRTSAFIISVIGTLDSLYLSWVKITHSQVYCGTSGQCETVNNSPYSEIGGVPIAYLGLGAYLVIIGLLYLEKQGGPWHDNSQLLVFGISLVGVIYSAYLTYLEIAVIRAICPYCVVSAIAMIFLFIISVIRILKFQTTLKPIHTRGG